MTMENRRRRATRRLRCLLALAGDYLKYLFMRRRRLMHKVARKALALVHYHHHHHKNNRPWPCAITEHEFSCADSPSPAFLAAKRLLLRSRLRKSSGAGAVMSSCCFGSFRAPPPFGWREAMALSEAEEESTEEEEVETTDDEEEGEEQAVLADDEEDEWLQCRGEMVDDVDDRAEEFINMFYQQLRAQSFAAVFQQGSP
ncbi:hypothetical protein QOZ80_2AG0132410 [Eleusine coracana subsp. coracana]|nr:hypothetical protein QOZ80_2AG0132410 [Eleusine coracana subsp. coracana]